MTTLSEAVKGDKLYKQLREICSSVEGSMDIKKLLNEARVLHSTRPSRELYKTQMEPTKLYLASTTDLSNRARLSELKATLFANVAVLDRAIDETETHLAAKFNELIRIRAKTVAERKTLMAKLLQTPKGISADLTYAMELLDIYIKDIDQASYSLQRCVDLVKLVVDRNSRVV